MQLRLKSLVPETGQRATTRHRLNPVIANNCINLFNNWLNLSLRDKLGRHAFIEGIQCCRPTMFTMGTALRMNMQIQFIKLCKKKTRIKCACNSSKASVVTYQIITKSYKTLFEGAGGEFAEFKIYRVVIKYLPPYGFSTFYI